MMKRRDQARRRLVAIAIVLGLAAPDARGGEDATSKSGDTIAGAKRDYEAITASKAGSEQQRLSLPKQSLPNLDRASPRFPTGHAPGSPYRKDGDVGGEPGKRIQKSENWLVDAVADTAASERTDETLDALTDGAGTPAVGGDLIATAAALERQEKAEEKDRQARDADETGLTVVNPLGAYMTSWLSLHDQALLNPAAVPAVGGANDVKFLATGNSGTPLSAAKPMAIFDQPDSSMRGGEINAIVARAPNPYLADYADLRREPLAEFSLPSASTTATRATIAEPVLLRGPAPVAEANSPVPLSESLRPQDEAKYFPQLKRF